VIAAAWICLFLPLAGALAITVLGNSIRRRTAGLIATASVAGAFIAGVWSFLELLSRDEAERAQASTAWSWLTAGNLDFGLEIYVDPLAVFMMLIVSGVGGLIVGYSLGYMDGADEERRFFAYMAFFVFSMLLLVESGNLLILLAAWGLVGLSSYFLIGFEHERPAAVAAAKKAFIVNAFGDATFALALFLLIQKAGTLEYQEVFAEAGGLSSTVATLVALGLLGGAVAKSAQLPLHTWLPDAMEGPTPVSALIHAATMVVAGVYLVFRMWPIFEAAPEVQDTAAVLGAVTLVVAGLIALVQTDMKRVVAYSTMSQIGYMFLAVGIGAYATGMFHLLTHAFFKALMFLAAGIIIHALAGEQDLRRMGGLRRLMPFTYVAFLVGSLALVGVPPFSGFFSKDPILAGALDDGNLGYLLFALGAAGAFLTGLYTFRMIFLAFGGEPSEELRARYHPHGG
jgi:NADH-quinone oxidoreductase subunit L